jgi:hypothetical protein
MRKPLMILVSMGLIMAFAMPVLGADVKFSGTYIIQGYYDSNRALSGDDRATGSRAGASQSDIWQRLRLQTDFQVAEGLKLTTRADIMERVWGNSRSATVNTAYATSTTTGTIQQEAYNQEAENIRFNNVYVTANILGGVLKAGYMTQGAFGTAFGDTGDVVFGPRLRYEYYTGPWMLAVYYDWYDGTKSFYPSQAANAQVEQETGSPQAAVVYTWAKGNAGLKVNYAWSTTNSGTTAAAVANGTGGDQGYKTKYLQFNPYFKAQFGPVYTEGEVIYRYGKKYAYEDGALFNTTTTQGVGDVTYNGWSGYAMANVDIKPAYIGGMVVYVAGDSPATPGSPNTTDTSGPNGGSDFNPCLILFNYDLMRWNGGLGWGPYAGGAAGSAINNSATGAVGITNALIGQLFGGVKPIPKLDIKAAVALARADKEPAVTTATTYTPYVSKNYGWEFDLTATYKIYDNLSYMVGFGYLWAGDFWKGTVANGVVNNDYLLTHKLTLSF